MRFDIKTPCDNCPFRSDGKGVPLERGAQKIANAIAKDDHQWFQCHKTLHLPKRKRSQCMGSMIVLWRMRMANVGMRLALAFGMLEEYYLESNRVPIFNSLEEFCEFNKRVCQ